MSTPTFLWYSRFSKETGTLLAERLGLGNAHGTVPPRNFNGVLICWGATPSNKFKWADRNLRAIFNDPRKVSEYRDRKVMFDKLAEAGINVTSCVTLTGEAQFANICNVLGATEQEGFIACKESGAKSCRVTTQAMFDTALDEGCNRAIDRKFAGTARIRIFVVGGQVVGALHRTPNVNDATFVARAAAEAGTSTGTDLSPTRVQAVLQLLLDKKLVVPGKSYWAPYSLSNVSQHGQKALAVAQALGSEFCAVDVEPEANGDILNVVTTPDLVSTPTIQAPIVNAIAAWIRRNSLTAKETLLAMINDASDPEADSLLEELRNIKTQLGNASNS